MKNFILSTALLLNLSSMAATYKVSTGDVEFTAKGFPSFITITGKSQKVMGDLKLEQDLASGTFKLPLKSLTTGMELRDDHMINTYLEAPKYPEATLTLVPFKLQEEGKTKAKLKLHNVEKEIEVNYKTSRSGKSINVETDFMLVLSDFEIAIPSFQGITVAKDIKLRVAFKATEGN